MHLTYCKGNRTPTTKENLDIKKKATDRETTPTQGVRLVLHIHPMSHKEVSQEKEEDPLFTTQRLSTTPTQIKSENQGPMFSGNEEEHLKSNKRQPNETPCILNGSLESQENTPLPRKATEDLSGNTMRHGKI